MRGENGYRSFSMMFRSSLSRAAACSSDSWRFIPPIWVVSPERRDLPSAKRVPCSHTMRLSVLPNARE
jgi:hypothetical protein